MKKKVLVSIVVGIFLISLVSAGLVAYLSNMVTATIEVKGPVFYAMPDGKLSINVEPENLLNAEEVGLGGIEKVYYMRDEPFSESLDFYPMNIEMQVNAMVTSGDTPKKLRLEFGWIKGSNRDSICIKEIGVTSNSNFNTYTATCSKSTRTLNVDGFYYAIEGLGDETVSYGIMIKDSGTKVSISKYE